jgi:hypothetical protein
VMIVTKKGVPMLAKRMSPGKKQFEGVMPTVFLNYVRPVLLTLTAKALLLVSVILNAFFTCVYLVLR